MSKTHGKTLATRAMAAALLFCATAFASAQHVPSGGAVVPGTTVAFSWPAIPDAPFYIIELDFNASFNSDGGMPWREHFAFGNTSANIPNMPNDGSIIYWRTKTELGNPPVLTLGPTQNFQNGGQAPLDAPNLAYPVDGVVYSPNKRVTFSWFSVATANGYEVEVADNGGFAPLDQTINATRTYAQSRLYVVADAGKTFSWRVRAKRTAAGSGMVTYGPYSAVRTFQVQLPAPDIKVTPQSLDLFADTLIYERDFTISNVGSGTLNVSQIALQNGSAWASLTTGTVPFNLNFNGTRDVTVRFDATGLGAGNFMDRVRVVSNDPDEGMPDYPNAVNLTLTSTGMPADNMDMATVFIKNENTFAESTDLMISSITVTSGMPWLTVMHPALPATLAENQQIEMTVTANGMGMETGIYLGSIEIASNDPDENPKTILVYFVMTEPLPESSPMKHPSDDSPYGNGDFMISPAEFTNYYDAWLLGNHNDFDGVLFAYDVSNGTGCYTHDGMNYVQIPCP